MSDYKCADCGATMQVDEWALKRGAPMTCGRCVPNLRAEVARLTRALEEARAEVERMRKERDDWEGMCGDNAQRANDAESECARLRGRISEAERERNLALAHDREVTARRSEDLVALAESQGLVARLRGQVENAELCHREAQREVERWMGEAERLRGQVEGAWRAGVEAAAKVAEDQVLNVAVLESLPPQSAAACVIAERIRSLPPPSAPADDPK